MAIFGTLWKSPQVSIEQYTFVFDQYLWQEVEGSTILLLVPWCILEICCFVLFLLCEAVTVTKHHISKIHQGTSNRIVLPSTSCHKYWSNTNVYSNLFALLANFCMYFQMQRICLWPNKTNKTNFKCFSHYWSDLWHCDFNRVLSFGFNWLLFKIQEK